MIVIDTHVLIWSLGDARRLSRPAQSALRREQDIRIPAICLWEFAMLAVRGRVNVNPLRLPAVFEQAFSNPAVSLQPLTPEIGIRAAQLSPGEPMDPADQLIAATALVLGVPLITSDDRLRSLPGVRSLW